MVSSYQFLPKRFMCVCATLKRRSHQLKVTEMGEWHYVQDVKKEKADAFCIYHMKQHPQRFYGIASARSNNPGMVAVYYRTRALEVRS